MTGERKRITETTLTRLPPKRVAWVIRDTEQRGFQIKILPSGQASYFVEARLGGTGKVKKFKIGNASDMPLKQAREKARAALAQIREGTDPKIEKTKALFEGMTLSELMETYFKSKQLKPRTLKDYRYYVDKQFPHWKNRRIADITKHEVLDWYQRGNKTPTHTHSAFRALRAMMNFAVGMEIIEANPCEPIKRLGIAYPSNKRNGHIPMEDLGKFMTAFLDYPYQRDSQRVARDVIFLILLTGLRPNEAATLKWSNVDFDRKRITLRDTKNGQDHIVPMTNVIYALLRHREEHAEKSPYVFRIKGDSKTKHITNYQKTLNGICDIGGVDRVTPHDLRRTFATLLNTLGVGYADVKHLMNHSVKDVTSAVYIQPDLRRMQHILRDVGIHYDLCVPFTDTPPEGFSRYALGTLRSYLYGKGAPAIQRLDDPHEEDQAYQAMMEHEYWEE